MQMRVGPSKGGLQDVMQLAQGDVAVDMDPSRDRRFDVTDLRVKCVDGVGLGHGFVQSIVLDAGRIRLSPAFAPATVSAKSQAFLPVQKGRMSRSIQLCRLPDYAASCMRVTVGSFRLSGRDCGVFALAIQTEPRRSATLPLASMSP
ncbi:hypothetical protein OKW46_001179 [Paraburkholderia sp. WSM4179]|nr:hypothetical protein [Paraburkholderia sp. WSM4179]